MAERIVKRVRASVLRPDSEGRACYGGARFSGLAYRIDDEGVVHDIQVYEDGAVTGVSDDWLALAKGVRVDRAQLQIGEDYGPHLFRGAFVDGVVYDFDGAGACVREEAFEAGDPTDMARREWYPSGAPKAVVSAAGGRAWFEDGGLRLEAVGAEIVLNLALRDDGRLGAIVLHDANLLDLGTLKSLAFDDEVLLTGRAIDKRLLSRLRAETGIGAVPRIRLVDTALGLQSVEILAEMPGLKELWLTRNRALGPVEAAEIQARLPGCTVHYEGAGEIADEA